MSPVDLRLLGRFDVNYKGERHISDICCALIYTFFVNTHKKAHSIRLVRNGRVLLIISIKSHEHY